MTELVNIFRIEHPVLEAGPCMAYFTLWDSWDARTLSDNTLKLLNKYAKNFFSGAEGKRLYDNSPAFLEEKLFKAFFIFNLQAMSAFSELPSPEEDDMPVGDGHLFGFSSEEAMYGTLNKESPFWRSLETLGFVINQVTVPATAVQLSKSKLQVSYNRANVISSAPIGFPNVSAM